MDNLTHSLVGLTAAKAGLEKLSPGATTLCILAANSPDADIVALIFGGRWSFLNHHRGISHSIIGAFVLACLLPASFYLGDWMAAHIRKRERKVKLTGLLLASILTTATHPLLDWTNNYGIRFLLPWNPKWFYGDFVFIIDPFFWMVLGGSAFLLTSNTKKRVIVWIVIALLPTYLVLAGSVADIKTANLTLIRLLWIAALIVLLTLYYRQVGARRGPPVAIAALVTVTIYCAGLDAAHAVALRQARLLAVNIANSHAEQLLEVASMPTVANPTQWLCVMDTNRARYKFGVSLRTGLPNSPVARFEKPDGLTAEMVAQASHDNRVQVFLGFARFPAVDVVGANCATQTLVRFADLRYTEPGKGRGTFSLDVPVDCPALSTLNNERH